MYGEKYSTVVGRARSFLCALSEFTGYGLLSANHSAVYHPVHHTTEF